MFVAGIALAMILNAPEIVVVAIFTVISIDEAIFICCSIGFSCLNDTVMAAIIAATLTMHVH